MHLQEINDHDAEQNFIFVNPKAVIFFGSKTCGHCVHMLEPCRQLSDQYPEVKFAHVEITKVDPKPINLDVFPIFAIYYNQVPIDKVVGADEDALQAAVDKLSNLK